MEYVWRAWLNLIASVPAPLQGLIAHKVSWHNYAQLTHALLWHAHISHTQGRPSITHTIIYMACTHFTVSETASFTGSNYIQYGILTSSVRPSRQASTTTMYTTAQNYIRLSLATTMPSGIILQLGDPLTTQEYIVLEVCMYSFHCDQFICTTYNPHTNTRTSTYKPYMQPHTLIPQCT